MTNDERRKRIQSHRIAIARLSSGLSRRPPSWDVIAVCAQVLGCGPYQITGRNRRPPMSEYRHIAAVQLLNSGYSTIQAGQALGGRDHSTIVYSRQKYEALYATAPAFRAKADAVDAACQAVFQLEKNEIEI